ncbi:MAG TPA: hypothetical protein VIK86_08060 [Candidatus Paceibacterota bacterium]
MNTMVFTDIQKLAFDAANGLAPEGYTKESINEAVRNAVKDACGGEWNYYKFMENRYKVFAIMAEIMPVAMNTSLAGKFDGFADFKDTALGDKNYFTIEDNTVYQTCTVSRGNGDIERLKIVDKNFSIPTITKAIKFYEELDNFITGRMDMARLTEKASVSMAAYMGELISDTIYGSYSSVGTPFKATGVFDATTLTGIIENVKAASGAERVQILGNTTALSKVVDSFGYSDKAKDSVNSLGYYGTFRGTDLISLPQGYRVGTQTLAVGANGLTIVPADEKIIKVILEGDAFVNMNDGTNRNDMQPEIFFSRKVGAAAITAVEGQFGLYRFS